jgi:hypothetical protein
MCGAQSRQTQSGGSRIAPASLGSRLDKAQRDANASSGGGTAGKTILSGIPRNSGVDAQRKNTFLGV